MTLRFLTLQQPAACRDGETLQPNGDLCQALAAACFMFRLLLSLRPERPQPAARPHAMLEGGLLRLAKLQCTAAQVHPWALDAAEALVPCLHICVDIATRRGTGGLSWRTLTSRAIRFLDLVLRSPHYHHMERVVTLRPPVRFWPPSHAAMMRFCFAAVPGRTPPATSTGPKHVSPRSQLRHAATGIN